MFPSCVVAGGHVYSAELHPDGVRVLTAGEADGTAWLCDRRTERQLEPLDGHQDIIFSATLGANGDVGASPPATTDGQGCGTSGRPDASGRRPASRATRESCTRPTCAWTEGGCSPPARDDTARLWRAEGGPALAVLEGHSKDVTGVAFDRAGTRAVTSSEDGTVRALAPGR